MIPFCLVAARSPSRSPGPTHNGDDVWTPPDCIIYYNALLLSQLAVHKERLGDAQGAALLAHVSPVAWQHINFYGRYEFSTGPEAINLEEIIQALDQVLVSPGLVESS